MAIHPATPLLCQKCGWYTYSAARCSRSSFCESSSCQKQRTRQTLSYSDYCDVVRSRPFLLTRFPFISAFLCVCAPSRLCVKLFSHLCGFAWIRGWRTLFTFHASLTRIRDGVDIILNPLSIPHRDPIPFYCLRVSLSRVEVDFTVWHISRLLFTAWRLLC